MKTTAEVLDSVSAVQPSLIIKDDFFTALRTTARERLQLLGIPDAKQEAYKYSNPQRLIKALSGISSKGSTESSIDPSKFSIPELQTIDVVLCNAQLSESSNIGNLPKGLSIEPISKVYERDAKLVMKALKTSVREDAFDLMNAVLLDEGVFIHISKAAQIEKVIQLINVFDGKNSDLINTNALVYVEEGAACKIVEYQLSSSNNKEALINNSNRIGVEKSANLEYYLIQDDSSLKIVNSYNVQLERSSVFRTNTITTNIMWGRNNLSLFVEGEHVETHLDGVFLLDKEQHLDNHTLVSHNVPNCESHQLYKGLLGGRSTGVFNGRIYVKRDAQKTNAYQSSKNILLSDFSTVNTKPELEIYADDVKCSHGSSTGKLDEEALFYLRSRGLGEESAKRILLQAFANDVLDEINIPELRDYLFAKVADRIKTIEM